MSDRPNPAPATFIPTLISVASLADLKQHEAEILKRIAEVPDGGLLFHTHPLLMLGHVGVSLSNDVTRELLRSEPRIAQSSAPAFQAILANPGKQKARVRLRGLFAVLHP